MDVDSGAAVSPCPGGTVISASWRDLMLGCHRDPHICSLRHCFLCHGCRAPRLRRAVRPSPLLVLNALPASDRMEGAGQRPVLRLSNDLLELFNAHVYTLSEVIGHDEPALGGGRVVD